MLYFVCSSHSTIKLIRGCVGMNTMLLGACVTNVAVRLTIFKDY